MTKAVAEALRNGSTPGWLWTHFPAGEARPKATGARLRSMGLQKGWSDFVLIAPSGVHYWLELKRGRAGFEPEQTEFALALLARGVPWAVARSVEEALHVLSQWGAIRLRVSA